MYFATKPSNLPITSETHLWYAPKTSRRSSGSSREASAVEPTRSQNITVSWRRSAVSARAGGDGAGGGGAVVLPIGFPQPPQNLAAGSFSKPQDGQGAGSGAPH